MEAAADPTFGGQSDLGLRTSTPQYQSGWPAGEHAYVSNVCLVQSEPNMNDQDARLQTVKLILASVLLIVCGVLLIVVGQLTSEGHFDGWVSLIPWTELGGIVVGAGLLSVWLDYFLRREQQALADRRLRQILHSHAPAMRDAVLAAFAASHEDLKRVATPETLDQIAANSLALRLGDEQFANEVWTDIRQEAIEAPERRYDAHLDVTLRPHPEAPGYFSVAVRWEYKTVPAHAQRRFVCLSDRREYAELVAARDGTTAWFKPEDAFPANERSTFELLQYTVNGQARTIRRASRKLYQSYAVDISAENVEASGPVTLSYTFRTVARADGNFLFFDIEQPTRDVSIGFDYSGCDIRTVSAIDQVPSARPTRIEHSPPDVPTSSVRVEIDGWVFPRAGVTFVWSLNTQAALSRPEGPA